MTLLFNLGMSLLILLAALLIGGVRYFNKTYGAKAEQAALVGDQIFTDVLGANCAGATSILVKPIHLSNIWLKLRHVAEQPFIFFARKRRLQL